MCFAEFSEGFGWQRQRLHRFERHDRGVTYARVSTAEQQNDGFSLDAQQARMRAWAEATGADIVDEIVDAAVSGTKPLAQRPGGAKVAGLLNARTPTADAVVVVRLDRLGRDAAESFALFKRFRGGKVGLVSIAEHVDLATAHGRAMAGLQMVFAELERALIAQRTVDALAELKRQGCAHNHAPYGWDVVDGLLKPNEAEQRVIRSIRGNGLEGPATTRSRGSGGEGHFNETGWNLGHCDSTQFAAGPDWTRRAAGRLSDRPSHRALTDCTKQLVTGNHIAGSLR
ncbi:MAG: recombinase family protein [Gammaproteobacteria bacterium]